MRYTANAACPTLAHRTNDNARDVISVNGPSSATAGPSGRAPRRGDDNPDKQHRDLADSPESPDSESGFAVARDCVKTPCEDDARKNRRTHLAQDAFLFRRG